MDCKLLTVIILLTNGAVAVVMMLMTTATMDDFSPLGNSLAIGCHAETMLP